MKEFLQRLIKLESGAVAWFGFVAPLLTRILLGYSYWIDGQGKLSHLDRVGSFFASLYIPYTHIPLPQPALQAHAISALEYVGGALLMIGFLTRPAALLLAGAMAGAVLMSDSGDVVSKWSDGSPFDVASLTNFLFSLWLVFWGAGPLSIDALLAWFTRRAAGEEPPLQQRWRSVVICWVLRLWIVLLFLALIPLGDGTPAHVLVRLGVRTERVRAPYADELQNWDTSNGPPPTEVTEYPPNPIGLALWFGGVLIFGLLGWRVFPPVPAPDVPHEEKEAVPTA
ncbi:MAG: DoxX family protein [Candidatus Xenobia bacterium]